MLGSFEILGIAILAIVATTTVTAEPPAPLPRFRNSYILPQQQYYYAEVPQASYQTIVYKQPSNIYGPPATTTTTQPPPPPPIYGPPEQGPELLPPVYIPPPAQTPPPIYGPPQTKQPPSPPVTRPPPIYGPPPTIATTQAPPSGYDYKRPKPDVPSINYGLPSL